MTYASEVVQHIRATSWKDRHQMELRPGTRLESAACHAQVVVVRAPAATDMDLRCGGEPMQPFGAVQERVAMSIAGESVQLGKRYADDRDGDDLPTSRLDA